jgi:recombinational DNA repair protein (RecF pathway)
LSSTIIEHLQQHTDDGTRRVTVYFYFDFKDVQKQDPELMLRSLLSQLLQHAGMIPQDLEALFSANSDGQQPPLLHALLEIVPQLMRQFTHVYIVLDALDECTQRPELMDMLETVAGWRLEIVHLLMTSRKERDIEMSLKSYIGKDDTVCLQRDVVDEDISRYVRQRLQDDNGLVKWNKNADIRQEIETALTQGAHGMYVYSLISPLS